MFFFDINLFKMIIYKVPNLSQKFCHSMKMKTTRIWVDLATDAQKIKVAVYCFAFGWKKDLMVFRQSAIKVKKPSRRSGVVVSFLSNKESPAMNHLFVKIHIIWLKTFSNPFSGKKWPNKKHMKIEETASAILGDTLFQICFLIEIA